MSPNNPVSVGIIGAGNISTQYLDNLTSFPDLKVLAVADLNPDAAAARAREYGIAHSGGAGSVLEHPDIEIVVNLTIPAAHVEIATAAVEAGKHVWSEKPFSLDRETGRGLLKAADAAGVRLGCAPDTFLGAGLQTALRIIREGAIGTPLTGMTMMQYGGPDAWHPNPEFLFQRGAGPLFDMGPYYLTALIQVFGPVSAVAAVGTQSRATRVIQSGDKAGQTFAVEVPTHVQALTRFRDGATAQSTFSFDSPLNRTGVIEITGSDATLSIPDPNTFDGDIRIMKRGKQEWITIPAIGSTASRGMGVLDMARAIRTDTDHRAPGELAYHVLDTMVSIDESMSTGTFITVESNADKSAALSETWDPMDRTF